MSVIVAYLSSLQTNHKKVGVPNNQQHNKSSLLVFGWLYIQPEIEISMCCRWNRIEELIPSKAIYPIQLETALRKIWLSSSYEKSSKSLQTG